jgi:hypothetical protein
VKRFLTGNRVNSSEKGNILQKEEFFHEFLWKKKKLPEFITLKEE